MPKYARAKHNKKTKPASSGRKGATKNARRDSVFDLADLMETPLSRAENLVRSLEYVGYGLSSLHEDGAPAVFAIAQALSENIEGIKNLWQLIFDQSAGTK